MNIYLRRNGPVPCFLPPHPNHQRIEQPSRLPLNTRLIDTLTPYFLSSNNLHLQHNTPLASAFTSTSLFADTTWSRPQGLQHQQPVMMMNLACPASSPISSMSSPSYTRSRNASYAARPQRPGPKQPPQPRDGDTRHMFNSVSASFALREHRSGGSGGDGPQPRDPGNGRRSRGPQPRDPGGKRDPQPRDPGT